MFRIEIDIHDGPYIVPMLYLCHFLDQWPYEFKAVFRCSRDIAIVQMISNLFLVVLLLFKHLDYH
jgi:hypothetical protein